MPSALSKLFHILRREVEGNEGAVHIDLHLLLGLNTDHFHLHKLRSAYHLLNALHGPRPPSAGRGLTAPQAPGWHSYPRKAQLLSELSPRFSCHVQRDCKSYLKLNCQKSSGDELGHLKPLPAEDERKLNAVEASGTSGEARVCAGHAWRPVLPGPCQLQGAAERWVHVPQLKGSG